MLEFLDVNNWEKVRVSHIGKNTKYLSKAPFTVFAISVIDNSA